jgi:hypothetical protein
MILRRSSGKCAGSGVPTGTPTYPPINTKHAASPTRTPSGCERQCRSATYSCFSKNCQIQRRLSAAVGPINHTTAAVSIRVATRLTIVRLPCPAFETLLVVTRLWLLSSATSRRTAEGSRARIRALAADKLPRIVLHAGKKAVNRLGMFQAVIAGHGSAPQC